MRVNKILRNKIEWSIKLFFLGGYVLSEFIFEDSGLSYYFEPESLVLLSILILGSFYCYHICPFGIISELFEKLGKKLLGSWRRKIQIPLKYDAWLRWLKYGFGIYFLSLFLLTDHSYFHGDHGAMYQSTLISFIYVIVKLTIAITILSFFFDRFYCRYLCYQKAWYNIVEKLSLTKLIRDDKSCIANCKACTKSCPMQVNINHLSEIRSDNDCISCYKCVNVCPDKASSLKIKFLSFHVGRNLEFMVFSAITFFLLSWVWKIFHIEDLFGKIF